MVQWLLEHLIRLLITVASPRPLVRSAEEQRAVDAQTRRLALYQSPTCPYCIRVWLAMRRLNLNIENRDISRQARWRSELKIEGGKIQVPCLRIAEDDGSARWLYESAEIVDYLSERFSGEPA